ncbi:hypothetical protein DQ04_03831070 [Trypanosoma grayi]|uniref:hypothetical protein n=1 Tax=Trypanosoma grayi TaxID=71804 RepID=UPI0004F4873B|nr:hypothetical protein DQ04_03831070 [Trypanosoma grayi]KEG10357.1 hypothetical protein DQ04_03831070 [Trypanosoma grayi]
MIPALNISKIADSSGKSGDHITGNGNAVDIARLQAEIQSSTPLRNRNAARIVPRAARDSSPGWAPRTGISSTLEDGGNSAELRRRAEEVSSVLGINALQVQDVHVLQCKAIEVAERLLRMEEWYNGQLQERSAYLEHRMSQLAAAAAGGQSALSAADKWVAPTTIRSRQGPNTTATVLGRSTMNVASRSPTRHGASTPVAPSASASQAGYPSTRTPDSSRLRLSQHHHSHQRQAVPLTSNCLHPPAHESSFSTGVSGVLRHTPTSKRQSKDTAISGCSAGSFKATGGERHKLRSSSLTISRGSRGSSDAGAEELLVEDATKRTKKRRSLGSSTILGMAMGSTTPKRIRPSSGRLGYLSETTKRV